MKCHWCKGTAAECGCGTGRCDHCHNGEVTDPPFGPQRYLDEEQDHIIPDVAFDEIIDWNIDYRQHIRVFSDKISTYLGSDYHLTDAEVEMFDTYWNDMYNDETIGDVMQRIAMFIKQKSSN